MSDSTFIGAELKLRGLLDAIFSMWSLQDSLRAR